MRNEWSFVDCSHGKQIQLQLFKIQINMLSPFGYFGLSWESKIAHFFLDVGVPGLSELSLYNIPLSGDKGHNFRGD